MGRPNIAKKTVKRKKQKKKRCIETSRRPSSVKNGVSLCYVSYSTSPDTIDGPHSPTSTSLSTDPCSFDLNDNSTASHPSNYPTSTHNSHSYHIDDANLHASSHLIDVGTIADVDTDLVEMILIGKTMVNHIQASVS